MSTVLLNEVSNLIDDSVTTQHFLPSLDRRTQADCQLLRDTHSGTWSQANINYITVALLSQVFLLVFLTICTVLFYFSVSCFVNVMAVLVTTLVLLLLINLDLD